MRRSRGWLFGLGLAAALGFGGAQAAAAPSPGTDDQARACNPTGCDRSCRAQGAISGRCTDAGLCACLF
ncbi:MAG TPA: hypothetical protein VHG93_21385 [Longimicrobium sp.]|nr:hypothetical protein [Longimicrobium sp.]